MADIGDLQAQIKTSIAQISAARSALAAQMSSASDTQQGVLQSDILSLSLKEAQLQTVIYVADATSADVTAAITNITSATTSISNENERILDATSAINSVTKILGYVTQIISILGPLLA